MQNAIKKNRREFAYDARRPAPTDRWVIPIFKEYLQVKAEIVESWKRGVVNGLLSHREYIDLSDCRMTVGQYDKGIVPVISLKPVIGFDNEAKLHRYLDFFKVYELYRNKLMEAVSFNIECEKVYAEQHDGEKLHRKLRKGCRSDERVVLLSNLLKIIISSFVGGVFTSEFAQVFLDGKEQFQELSISVRSVGLGETIGENFMETGNLIADVDSDLIGSFYRYIRKKREADIQSTLAIWASRHRSPQVSAD